jgi:hypothetical protein
VQRQRALRIHRVIAWRALTALTITSTATTAATAAAPAFTTFAFGRFNRLGFKCGFRAMWRTMLWLLLIARAAILLVASALCLTLLLSAAIAILAAFVVASTISVAFAVTIAPLAIPILFATIAVACTFFFDSFSRALRCDWLWCTFAAKHSLEALP